MRCTTRQGVFETNSSSTHAIVYINDDNEDYKHWTEGELFLSINEDLDRYDTTYVDSPEFITKEEAIRRVIDRDDDELHYYLKDTDKKNYTEGPDHMLESHDYRPFVEVGIIPYEAKNFNYDSGMIQFDLKHDGERYLTVVTLDFMII